MIKPTWKLVARDTNNVPSTLQYGTRSELKLNLRDLRKKGWPGYTYSIEQA